VMTLGAFAPGMRFLDLYCGAGNFALPIARRGAVVEGVEQSTIAVDAARENAVRLGLAGATFAAARVRDALAARPAGALDVVVLDPPRAGAADALRALAALRAPRILYVACDPATLARDVRGLATGGYRAVRIVPVDLFPQTYHIETVAELVLT
jgi:23S rRNA (uracil1939-C5)-methyltransferase